MGRGRRQASSNAKAIQRTERRSSSGSSYSPELKAAIKRISALALGESPSLEDFTTLCHLEHSPSGIIHQKPQVLKDSAYGDPQDIVCYQNDGRSIQLKTTLLDKTGKEIGESEIWFSLEGVNNDVKQVKLSYLKLDDSAKGTGYGRYRHKELEKRFRDAGIDQITIWAQHTGSYMWASEGYDFDIAEGYAKIGYKYPDATPEILKEVREKDFQDEVELCFQKRKGYMEDLLRDEKIDASLLETFEEDMKSGKVLTPKDILEYGKDNTWLNKKGFKTWFGKELMLENEWRGIKYLNADPYAFVSSEELYKNTIG